MITLIHKQIIAVAGYYACDAFIFSCFFFIRPFEKYVFKK